MRLSSIFFCLFFISLGLSNAFAQNQELKSEDCDYSKTLKIYILSDSLEKITDPQLLYEMATLAATVRSKDHANESYQRILDQEELNDQLIYYQAMLDQAFRYNIAFDPDSTLQVIQQLFGVDHEICAVYDLTQADYRFRARQKVNLDSIIPLAISKIKSKELYKNFITISLQDLSRDYADKGNLKEGLRVAKELSSFVRTFYPECAYEVGGTDITLGRRHLDLDNLDSAAYYFERSLDFYKLHQPDDYQAVSTAALNLADVIEQKGYHSRALKVLRDLEFYVLKDTAVSKTLLPNIYNAIGINYREMDNKYKAIQYFRKSVLFSEKASPGPSIKKLAAYANISSEFMAMDQLNLAESYANLALDISRKLLGDEHRYTAILLMKLGSINFEKENYTLCKSYFDQSLALRKKIYGDNHSALANLYLNYAQLQQALKEYDQALANINTAIKNYEGQYGKVHPRCAEAYQQKAQLEFLKGNYSAADLAIENGIDALGYQQNFKTVSDPIMYLRLILQGTDFKLQTYKENGTGDLKKIIESYDYVLNVFNYHLELMEELGDISEFASSYNTLFDNYVEALILEEIQGNCVDCLELAFSVNNKGKNLGLLTSLKQQSQMLHSNIPKDLWKMGNDLKRGIKVKDQQLAVIEMERSAERTLILDSLNQLREELSSINRQINAVAPTFNQTSNPIKGINLSKEIPPTGSQLAIIDYRILDSALVTFSLFNGEIRFNYRKLDSNFSTDLDLILSRVIAHDPDYLVKNNTIDAIIQPISNLPDEIEQLIIIPDENLSSFPFEILPINGSPLLSTHAISYANSVSILRIQQSIEKDNHEYVFSGFAPDYDIQADTTDSKLIAGLMRSGNWELPFAKEEVKYINALLNGQIFLGKKASKTKLFEALENSQIIHLSMHAQANNESPMNSSFIFSTDTLQASENLLLYELTNLNARSNLVVLSACETGIGAFHQGDGVRSLGNGFLHSGIPSVVMSLWKVPDESTSIIMKNFYTFLKEGHSKAAALQKAKQEYLAKAISVEQKHPYYWAGFILSGNEAPIKLDTGTAYNKIALFALGLVLLIGLILYYRKKQNT